MSVTNQQEFQNLAHERSCRPESVAALLSTKLSLRLTVSIVCKVALFHQIAFLHCCTCKNCPCVGNCSRIGSVFDVYTLIIHITYRIHPGMKFLQVVVVSVVVLVLGDVI